MQNFALSVYVLMWPVVVAAVLVVISRAFLKEVAEARREGRDVI